jgi:hypothetical protein
MSKVKRLVLSVVLAGGTQLFAQQFQQVSNPPSAGTFFPVSWVLAGNSVPWPFDPLPDFPAYEDPDQPGIFYVDDVGGDAMSQLAQQQTAAQARAAEMPPPPPPPGGDGGGGGGGGSDGWTGGLDWTNNPGLYLFPPFVQGSVVSLTWTNTDGGGPTIYDVLMTTNLCSDVPGLNGTNWAWLGRITNGQTVFYAPFIAVDTCFYRLGYVTNDPCGEGIGIAYKRSVAHVDPSFCGLSTDGLGTPDGWYLAHGITPTLGIGGQDPNGNGIPNYQEYLRGGDPLLPAATGIWVATPSGFSGIP